MTNPLIKGIGVLATAAFAIPPASAQDNAIRMQNYTSDISISSCDGHTVLQQVGAPLGYPVIFLGDDILRQGLFGLLTEMNSSTSGVGDIAYTRSEGLTISFDQVLNSLHVGAPSDSGKLRIAVTDTAGAIIFTDTSDDSDITIQLPTLTPGIYVATAATANNNYNSIKFTVK